MVSHKSNTRKNHLYYMRNTTINKVLEPLNSYFVEKTISTSGSDEKLIN